MEAQALESEMTDFVSRRIQQAVKPLITEKQRNLIVGTIFGFFGREGIPEVEKAFPKLLTNINGQEVDVTMARFEKFLETLPRKLGCLLIDHLVNREYDEFLNALVEIGYLSKDEKNWGAIV